MKALNEVKTQQVLSEEFSVESTNVLDFASTLKELRKNVAPELIRHREASGQESVRTVDYVEWHTIADLLDQAAPNWAHSVKDIRTIGDFVVVTVGITIDGVTREGVGTGSARSETGIKKAEHDALKRAAVKFGLARDLYKRSADAIDHEPSRSVFPADPVAKTLAEMVTTKQLGMIRVVAREAAIDADKECLQMLNCRVSELSRRAASALIDHLRELKPQELPLRKAG
ncbi:MAG: Rad52/Rad22 family DNA repair protein [bacterium]|nr:Rad52/Rad22 family DNA repair protein [bacterium]